MWWTAAVVSSLLSVSLGSPHQSNAAWDFTITHDKTERATESSNSTNSNYKLRGKTVDPSALGVDAVKQYVGYLDDGEKNKHLFCWFLKSRNDPSNDPFILWLKSPRTWPSSAIPIPGTTKLTSYTLTNPSTQAFPMAPPSTPRSPPAKPFSPSSSSSFRSMPPSIFTLPANPTPGTTSPPTPSRSCRALDSGINLKSILIGNGYVDPYHQVPQYPDMACGRGGPYERNPYDMRKQCEGGLTNMCYRGVDYVTRFLNGREVTAALGVEVPRWTACSDSMDRAFQAAGDDIQPVHRHVRTVLENGLPVLIYAGDVDYILNWLGQRVWTDALQWSGHGAFRRAWTRDLTMGASDSTQVYGTLKHAKGLAFARIFKAGHLVPMDKPKPILDLVNRWVGGEFQKSASMRRSIYKKLGLAD